MSDQFVGEIRVFGCNFAPFGWAQCDGQILPIAQNTALFSLLGTQFGGNGTSNFALPNLQGCFPLNQGNGAGLTPRVVGETGGEAAVTLIASQMPVHTHNVNSAATSNSASPANAVFGGAGRGKPPAYAPGPVAVSMSPTAVGTAGSGLPHNNLPPYQVQNFCIALQGIFPPRS